MPATIEMQRVAALIDPRKMRVLHAVARGGMHVFEPDDEHAEDLAALEDASLVTSSQTSFEGRAILFVLPTFAGWRLATLDTRAEGAPMRAVRRRFEKRGERPGDEISDLLDRVAAGGLEKDSEDPDAIAPADRAKLRGLGLVDSAGNASPVAIELGGMIRDERGRARP